MIKNTKLFVAFIILTLVFSAGCEKDTDENVAPVIHLFQANPADTEVGGQVTLSVLATDADGDSLTYIYQSNTGTVTGTGNTVTWTAPATAGKYAVKVNVSDGRVVTRSTIIITVLDKQPPVFSELIVPGEQASGIKLGDTLDQVEALYGKGEEKVLVFTFYVYPELGIAITVDGTNRVDHIFIFEPNKSKTSGGNGIRSTLVSVKEEFGEAEEIEVETQHWYWTKGIEFDYDADFKVVEIYIFERHIPEPVKSADMLQLREKTRNSLALKEYHTIKRTLISK